ncbi:hypothetical protein [Desulfonatronum thioautotrophicum]|uniref:hypothetical protein n=1 Tax=Desulfonatronum thioautotrophicum TaxID=617001 RepID=UPI001FC9E7ED|nr:hypothetical protein [Desulfonatronum thioautotrophicum]
MNILITGEELHQLRRHSYQMAEAFGLDRRIENYQGKRPIGLHSWDFDCLLAVIQCALEDERFYPDKEDLGYKALMNLYERLKKEYQKFD